MQDVERGFWLILLLRRRRQTSAKVSYDQLTEDKTYGDHMSGIVDFKVGQSTGELRIEVADRQIDEVDGIPYWRHTPFTVVNTLLLSVHDEGGVRLALEPLHT